MKERFDALNMTVALLVTRFFGTVAVFYIFFVYGLLPIVPQLTPYRDLMQYWSTWIQLWALPIILVGTNLMADQQAKAQAATEAHREAVLVNQAQMLEHLDALMHQANQTNAEVLQAVQHEAGELDELLGRVPGIENGC